MSTNLHPASDLASNLPALLHNSVQAAAQPSLASKIEHQMLTFDDLGTPLVQAVFLVVDLETTGGNCETDAITEIGAVKIQGGQVIGEFQTFVNPGIPIPAFISVLTGITDRHVAQAPTIKQALASFVEFAGFFGSQKDAPILVAHNARFDVGFLKAACQQASIIWPQPRVIDTVLIARRVLRHSEVRNHKLSTLAQYFQSPTSPTHRALDDARATVHVLHGLIERLGNLGVDNVESLLSFDGKNTEKRRRKRHLAKDVPALPGVYVFHDNFNRPLYIGTSQNMRSRVMSYFTAAESRSRMTAMVELANRVEAIVCSTTLEANVREVRLIHQLQPRFNFKSRKPERTAWLTLTNERFPRLSIIRHLNPLLHNQQAIGPFRSHADAQNAMDALHEVFPIRQCKLRLTKNNAHSACALYDMGRCNAPCLDGSQTTEYYDIIQSIQTALHLDITPVVSALESRMNTLAQDMRFEEAATVRDRLVSVTTAAHRATTLRSLINVPQIVAAANDGNGGWDIHVIKFGWLAASSNAPYGTDPVSMAKATVTTSATLPKDPVLISEVEMLHRWLSDGQTRLISISPEFGWHSARSVWPYSPAKA